MNRPAADAIDRIQSIFDAAVQRERGRHDYECPQCVGRGCAWCRHTGRVSEDRLREVRREVQQMDDDREWAARSNERLGG